MHHISKTPFDSIESAHEYMALLAETIEESILDVENQTNLAHAEQAERRKETLQLVSYKLAKLTQHIHASRRILNDLRTLRCLLHGERTADNHSSHPRE